jgi:hypothetical protein
MNAKRSVTCRVCWLPLLAFSLVFVGCGKDSITSPLSGNKESYQSLNVQNLDFTNIQHVATDTSNGHITVRAQAYESPSLAIRKIVRAPTRVQAQQVAESIKIDVQIVNGGLVIRPIYSEPGPEVEIQIDFDLACPPGINFDLGVANGAISIEGTTGSVVAGVGNGRIDIESSDESVGAVTASVVNGVVAVNLVETGTYDVTATTVNGCIVGSLGETSVDQCNPIMQKVHLGRDGGVPYDLRVINGTIGINVKL